MISDLDELMAEPKTCHCGLCFYLEKLGVWSSPVPENIVPAMLPRQIPPHCYECCTPLLPGGERGLSYQELEVELAERKRQAQRWECAARDIIDQVTGGSKSDYWLTKVLKHCDADAQALPTEPEAEVNDA